MNANNPSSPTPKNKNSLATASLVLGILALLGSFMCLSIPLGSLSILFSLLSHVEKKWDVKAILGIILSGVGVLLSIIMGFFYFNLLTTSFDSSYESPYPDYFNESPYSDYPYENLPYDLDPYEYNPFEDFPYDYIPYEDIPYDYSPYEYTSPYDTYDDYVDLPYL